MCHRFANAGARRSAGAVGPVFVVGGTRRERALLRSVVEPNSDLGFAPESDTLARLVQAIADGWDTLAYEGYPEQHWYKAAAATHGSARAARAAADGKTRWVECIDATTLSLGTIDRLFPTCQVVHLVSGNPFDLSARSMRKGARALSAGRYSEVSLRDLRAYPTVVRRAVLDRLGSPASQPVAA